MKVTYIHHSSFCVELDHAALIFDYTEGPWPDIDPGKTVVIFASHRHGDHFSPVIFEKARQYDDVRFVLSDDIWKKRVPEELLERTSFVKPGAVLEIGEVPGMTAETFRSTDEGVAFWVSCEGKTIYHAGDLNNWRWEGEPDPWNPNMDRKYHEELQKMSGRRADLAFLPLDPRQEQWFYLGMDEFLKSVDADLIFPMHCWGDYSVIARMKQHPCSAAYRDRIVEIQHDGQRLV